MAIVICPVCGSEMSDKADVCPLCEFPVADMEQVREKREEDRREFITICKRCCHFAIVRNEDMKQPCAMCGGEITQVMTRAQWFAMVQNDREKAAKRAVAAMKNAYTYNALLHRQYGSRVRIDKNVLAYCPRCGQYTSAHFASERGNACTYCATDYTFTDVLYHDVHEAVMEQLMAESKKRRTPDGEDEEEPSIDRADYVQAMDDYVMEHYLKDEKFFNTSEMERRKKGKG